VSAICSSSESSDFDADEESDADSEDFVSISDHDATSTSSDSDSSEPEQEQNINNAELSPSAVRDSRVEVEVLSAIPEVEEHREPPTPQANTTVEIALSQEHHHVLAAQTQEEIQHDIEQVQALSRVSDVVSRLSQAPIPAPRQRPLRRQIPPAVAPRPRRAQPTNEITSLEQLSTQQLVARRLSSPQFLARLSAVLDGEGDTGVVQPTRVATTSPRTNAPQPAPRQSFRLPQIRQQTQAFDMPSSETPQPPQPHLRSVHDEDTIRPPDQQYVSRLLQPHVTAPVDPNRQVAEQVDADITELLTRRLVQTMLNGEYRTVLEVHLQQRAQQDGSRQRRTSQPRPMAAQRPPTTRAPSFMSQLRQRLRGRSSAPPPPPPQAAMDEQTSRSHERDAQHEGSSRAAASNFRTMHALQQQVHTLSQQMTDMMSMVRTTY
jgi:hypothetical protein